MPTSPTCRTRIRQRNPWVMFVLRVGDLTSHCSRAASMLTGRTNFGLGSWVPSSPGLRSQEMPALPGLSVGAPASFCQKGGNLGAARQPQLHEDVAYIILDCLFG